jgi:hypothetical protein
MLGIPSLRTGYCLKKGAAAWSKQVRTAPAHSLTVKEVRHFLNY